MRALLQQISPIAAEAARAHVGDDVEVTTVMPLTRGVDPFAGRERPLMFAAARWMAVSPGGVMLAGTAAAAAAILGFELPERAAPAVAAPPPPAATPADAEGGEEGESAEASAPAAAPEATAEPTNPEGENAESDAPAEAPWSERACDAARPALTAAALAIAAEIAALTDLPGECAPVQVALTSEVRQDAGPVPDGVALTLQKGPHELLVVVVTPGVFLAHLAAEPATPKPEPVVFGDGAPVAAADIVNGDAPTSETDPETVGDAPAAEAPTADPAGASTLAGSGGLTGHQLRGVPLELAVRMGRARMPLAAALELVDGDVIELEELVDDAVELVAGSTPVASGTLEVGEHGALLLHVGSTPA